MLLLVLLLVAFYVLVYISFEQKEGERERERERTCVVGGGLQLTDVGSNVSFSLTVSLALFLSVIHRFSTQARYT